MNKYKYNVQDELAKVLEDINQNDLRIHSAIFDKQKRCVALCMMGASAYYACEYCESKAHLLTDNKRQEKKQLV